MENKTFAIIAFILAFFIPLVGIILGIIALRQIKKSGGEGKGFAIAAIIISAVIIIVPILLVGLGAIAYFGVLSPSEFLPSKCVFPAGISCIDFKVESSSDQILVILRNGLGFDLTGITLTASGCTISPSYPSMLNGEQKTFTLSECSLTKGDTYSGNLDVTYINADTGLIHTAKGSITTRVE